MAYPLGTPALKGRSAIYLLYNLVLLAASPLLVLGLLYRLARGKSRAGWGERWGHLSVDPAVPSGRRLWVHAASVGEVAAVTPVLERYLERRPCDQIVMTVVTPGGYDVASRLVGSLLHGVYYAPFDVPWAVGKTAARLRADAFVCVETELWPNLIHLATAGGAGAALVNARLSDRSFPRYRSLRSLFGWVLGHFHVIAAQSQEDADRLRIVGAPSDRLRVLGNTKFDQAPEPLSPDAAASLRAELRMPAGAPVFVVASTRTAREEELVLQACKRIRESVPSIAIVFAPRHVERCGEVAARMQAAGFPPTRRTGLQATDGPVPYLLLDTFGELAHVYAVADVAFVGNSLVPPGGGQNPLQPLAQGKPVLYGPYTSNFRDVVGVVERAGVGRRVENAEALAGHVLSLLGDPLERQRIGEAAIDLVALHRGVAAGYAEVLAALPVDGAHRGGC